MVAVLPHAKVELVFPRMSEGRVADVVNEGQRFGKIGIEVEGSCNSAGDLRNLERVGEAIAKMVGVARGEDLRFGFEAAKGSRMNYAVAVARIIIAIRVGWFGIPASAGARHVHGVRRERCRGHGVLRTCQEAARVLVPLVVRSVFQGIRT